ncbi:MAG: hypothetical protein FJ088_16585, partial [Deltaproteobacteria bacterium]|nr:hypothetical protein [Deltaproteobacteria bacterium]
MKDKKILAAIARETLHLLPVTRYPLPTIIEIGPGHGELTQRLLALSGELQVIGIEKDGKLIPHLSALQERYKNFEIVAGDVRNVLPELAKSLKLKAKTCTIVGNIPYYLTGYLLRLLGDLVTHYPLLITKVVLLVQKEVAERVCAMPPHMNLLAAAVQFWAVPRIAAKVPPGTFSPPPKVSSAVLILTPHEPPPSHEEALRYYALIKKLFRHPRKTAHNNLVNKSIPPILQKLTWANINP